MKKYIILTVLCVLTACTQQDPETEPRLVVEGWIESDGTPIVLVTTSVTPTREPQTITSLTDHVEKWARVSLWDGDKEVKLTGFVSSRYTPPYYFTTGRMIGETGKTYRITVDSKGRHAEAVATIPEPQLLMSIDPVPFGDDGDQYLLKARFKGAAHCKFFTLIEGTDDTYVPAITSLAGNGESEITEVTIRPGNSLHREEKRPSFRSGENVHVKCCTMDDNMYSIWKALDDLIYMDRTAFFTLDTNLPGNVDGAVGYFAGYGKTEYLITLP